MGTVPVAASQSYFPRATLFLCSHSTISQTSGPHPLRTLPSRPSSLGPFCSPHPRLPFRSVSASPATMSPRPRVRLIPAPLATMPLRTNPRHPIATDPHTYEFWEYYQDLYADLGLWEEARMINEGLWRCWHRETFFLVQLSVVRLCHLRILLTRSYAHSACCDSGSSPCLSLLLYTCLATYLTTPTASCMPWCLNMCLCGLVGSGVQVSAVVRGSCACAGVRGQISMGIRW
jgi:hypothetical protein